MTKSKYRKIAIISQYDTVRKEVALSGKPRRDAMMRDFHLWTHLETGGKLVEELQLVSDKILQGERRLRIWDMPSYSSIYLHSAIKEFDESVEVKVIDYVEDENKSTAMQELADFGPDMVFISTTFCLRLSHLTQLLGELRNSIPEARQCVGGHFIFKELHYSDDPNNILEQIGDDIIVVSSLYGEKEVGLVLADEFPQAPELLSLDDQSARDKTGAQEFVSSRVHYKGYPFKMSVAPVRTSIGCPFNCAFCSYHEMAGRYRMRDIENIVEELQELHDLGIKNVVFIDDTLNMPKERFLTLLNRMIEKKLLNFNCYSFCRCQFIDDEIAEKMAQCGFQSVLLGIESGSELVLTNMNKKASPDEYLQGIKKLKANGITTFCAIIVGFPGETEETIQASVDFVNTSGVDYVYVQPFFCLHNSPVYKDREKFGLSGEGGVWKHDTMTSKQCYAAVRDIFNRIDGAQHTHLENTMWEYVYFRANGFSVADYSVYRRAINAIRANQIEPKKDQSSLVEDQLALLRGQVGTALKR